MDKHQEGAPRVETPKKNPAEIVVQIQVEPLASALDRLGKLAKEVEAKLGTGEMTVNEAREVFGLEPLAEPAANERYQKKGCTEKMVVYFAGEPLTREVPENILSEVRRGFTRFEVSYSSDGAVTVCVPQEELAISERLRLDIQGLIREIGESNGALAWKLARHYRV